LAIGFSRGCRQLGVRIPDDVSLLGFEDGEELLGIDPPMTAMRQPAREIGKHAARLLLKQISEQGNKDAAENDAEKNLFEIPLVVRGSVKNNLD
jgi:DNA-binding LacI/PurR family transcriptional regulator